MSQFESDPKKWLPPITRVSGPEPSRREEARIEGFYQDDDNRLWESEPGYLVEATDEGSRYGEPVRQSYSNLMCLELDFMISAIESLSRRAPGLRDVYEPALAEHAYRLWWFEKHRGNL